MSSIAFTVLPPPEILKNDVECFRIATVTEAAELAVARAGAGAVGGAAASDAFFPMPDGIETLGRAGVRSVIHPGGSKRDADVLAAADSLGMAVVHTGERHFRH